MTVKQLQLTNTDRYPAKCDITAEMWLDQLCVCSQSERSGRHSCEDGKASAAAGYQQPGWHILQAQALFIGAAG